jgi:hypothetical protein
MPCNLDAIHSCLIQRLSNLNQNVHSWQRGVHKASTVYGTDIHAIKREQLLSDIGLPALSADSGPCTFASGAILCMQIHSILHSLLKFAKITIYI